MKFLLKTKLIMSFVLVVLVSGIISIIIGTQLIGDGIIKQAQDKVRLDLNSAREVYQRECEHLKNTVRLNAIRFFMKDAILENNRQELGKQLQIIKDDESLDMLTLIDEKGCVIIRARNPTFYGEQVNDIIVDRVLLEKQVVVATQILSSEELRKEGSELAEQARIEFIPTPKARPISKIEETSGMVIKAAAPVFDYEGKLIGVLYGGKLLNRNYDIVDNVKDIVYRGEQYKEKDIGTATIFQGDLRISTNVKNVDGTRAIGTRVSEEVYNQVIGKGLPWIDRAFVVNNWYITAYEPIRDIKNDIIGILYVGILEQKFTDMRNNVVFVFLGITIIGIAIAFGISFILANTIVRPVGKLATASRYIADGDFSYKVDIRSKDEIGELGDVFNFMVTSIRERDEKIKEFAQAKIAEAERLAMIGQLAAGVAHEINNPLTGILLYSNLLFGEFEQKDTRKDTLAKIIKEATRCKNIVKGLLDFARQTEPETKPYHINEIIDDVVSLVKKHPLFLNIDINKKLEPSLPMINIDASQIQQVFMNIILNAAEAMDGKGELMIATGLSDDTRFVTAYFHDTGCGISKENLERIFDPFFTTKEIGHGTGLGLSISYGIIRKHNGEIDVASELGKGTTFTVRFPVP